MPIVAKPLVRSAIAAACALALLATFFAVPALPQGMTATAKPAAASTTDASAMKRRIDELERRVRELEKERAEQVEVEKDDDTAAKKLEQRLAAIEASQKKADAADEVAKGSKNESDFDPLNVVAPFIVRDEDGKPLLRVDRSPKGAARLIVGNPLGSQAILAASATGGAMQLVDSTNTVRVSAVSSGSPGHSGVVTQTTAGFAWIGDNQDGVPVIQIKNKSETPVAELRGMLSQTGQLRIMDAAGTAMVVAGVSTKGVGVVKTGPNGTGVAVLLGNAGLPASEIQGKK